MIKLTEKIYLQPIVKQSLSNFAVGTIHKHHTKMVVNQNCKHTINYSSLYKALLPVYNDTTNSTVIAIINKFQNVHSIIDYFISHFAQLTDKRLQPHVIEKLCIYATFNNICVALTGTEERPHRKRGVMYFTNYNRAMIHLFNKFVETDLQGITEFSQISDLLSRKTIEFTAFLNGIKELETIKHSDSV